MQMGRLTLLSAIVAALGGFLFGFDTAVISGTTSQLEKLFRLTPQGLGLTVSSAIIGTVLGSILSGKPADRWGRKPVMLAIAILYLISALGCAWAWSWHSLLFFRFIGGLAVGASSVISPMYIAEISPPQWRGRLVAITQLNIVVGILAAFFSNYLISSLGLGSAEWRWMFGVEAIPAGLFLILIPFIPRSPRWLVSQGRHEQARQVLIRLGTPLSETERLLAEISESLRAEQAATRVRFLQRKYIKPILLAVAIAAFNQLSGINAILYYAPRIFEMAGAGKDTALLQTVVVGGTNLIFTVLAMLAIDKLGRRFLMLIGSFGYIISLAVITVTFAIYGEHFTSEGNFIVLVAMILFIASHAFGQGAVIWVFISEIFPNEVRARGQALGSFTHWAMNSLVVQTFPSLSAFSAAVPFGFYTLMMICQLLWVLLVMPETKGVPLERIKEELGIS